MIKNLLNQAPKVGFRFVASLLLLLAAAIPGFAAQLSSTSLTLKVGDTHQLEYTLAGTESNWTKQSWASSDAAVATVENGLVTAVGEGDAVITLTLGYGTNPNAQTLTCAVKVEAAAPAPTIGFNLQTEADVEVGKTVALGYQLIGAEDSELHWRSSDENIATVENGVVTGVAEGKVTVYAFIGTATDKKAEASCEVTVKAAPVVITLNETAKTLKVGESFALVATVENAPEGSEVWLTCTEKDVVAVKGNETVEAVGVGEATVVAELISAEGETLATAECKVTVEAAPAPVIDFNLQNPAEVEVGKTVALGYQLIGAEDSELNWRSTDESIATVENGVVTGVAEGKVTIYAFIGTATDKKAEASCEVTVKPAPVYKEIILPMSAEFEVGDVVALDYALKGIAKEEVKWMSSDKEVATVDAEGNITCLAEGKTVITAFIGDATSPEVSATCNVTVVEPFAPVVKEILLSPSTEVEVGETDNIPYVLRGIEKSELKWLSMNKEIATVDEEGNVTGVAEGEVEIVAFVGDATSPEVSASCKVYVVKTVVAPVYEITLNTADVELTEGEKFNLVYTVSENRPEGYYVLFTSSDKAVVTVDATGCLTAVGEGTATITAQLCKGTYTLATAECAVTVLAKVVEPSISFEEASIKLFVGNEINLTESAVIKDAPEGAYIMWSSSESEFASIDVNGVVRGLAPGTTTITANLMKGTFVKASAQLEVVVVAKPIEHSMLLSVYDATLQEGETLLITPILRGAVEEGMKGEVKWLSSDESVATVGLNTGVVTAVGEGKATIKAIWLKGTHTTYATATCEITVVPVTETPEPASIVLEETSAELTEGETTQIVAVGHNLDEDIKFLSMNQEVATVDKFGLVTAVAEGETTILVYTGPATNPTVSQEFQVKVVAKPAEPVYTIALDVEEATLLVGEALNLKSTVSENRPDGYYVLYTSSDKNVATVTATGTVIAVAEGTATITAELCKGTYTLATATCEVTVVAPVEEPLVSFDSEAYGVEMGKTLDLTNSVTISEDAPERAYIMWSSSDTEIATINVNGVVTPVAEGTVTITAHLMKGTHEVAAATCEVVVSAEVPEVKPSVSLDIHEATLYVGEGLNLKYAVENAPKGYYTLFHSSDKNVAVVTRTGTVTAMSVGTATITVELCKGTYVLATDVCVINVEAEVTSISVTPAEATVATDENIQLVAEVEGEESADETIVWASSNNAVATVDENGLVTPVAPGVATISATTVNNLTSFSVITVTNQSSGIEGIEGDNAAAVVVEGNNIIVPEDAIVYNINGVVVNPVNLNSGVYIVRLADGQSVKVVL